MDFAKTNPTLRVLYLYYNSSMEKAAKGKLPRNAVCKIAYSLAHAVYGTQYTHKKAKNLRLTDIAHGLDTQDWELVCNILTTLNNYMVSVDTELGRSHFPHSRNKAFLISAQERFLKQGLGMVRVAWKHMVGLQGIDTLMPHGGYLKLCQLSKPGLSQRPSYMLLDEGQDINLVIVDIAYQQRIKVTTVDDPHQQLYRFKSAGDALNSDWTVGAKEHYLIQNWRFSPAITHVANIIPSYKSETQRPQGLGPQMLVRKSLLADPPHHTFIHRTIIGVIKNALQRICNDPAPRFCWVGGIDGYLLRDLEDLYAFSRGLCQNAQNKRLLRDYRDYTQYVEIAETSQGSEALRSIKIILTYPDLPAWILELRSLALDDELDATTILTTVHKVEGLEWDFVCLCDGFNTDLLAPDTDLGKRDDESNLICVAVIRTMKVLVVNSLVLPTMQRHVGERKLKELMISSRK